MPQPLAIVLRTFVDGLSSSGADTPRLDARILVAHVLGLEPSDLTIKDGISVSDSDLFKINEFLERRLNGEPVSRIIGEREFWSLPFYVTEDTLDPRPDTETLVDAALDQVSRNSLPVQIVLDAGTGSGCLLLALLTEWPEVFGIGVDMSLPALGVAQRNAERLGLAKRCAFVGSDWLGAIGGEVDLIVCNPPYIAASQASGLSPSVLDYDPHIALFGGTDGLDAVRVLAPEFLRVLRPDGVVVIEIGQGQTRDVSDILTQSGFSVIQVYKDLAGVERCLLASQK